MKHLVSIITDTATINTVIDAEGPLSACEIVKTRISTGHLIDAVEGYMVSVEAGTQVKFIKVSEYIEAPPIPKGIEEGKAFTADRFYIATEYLGTKVKMEAIALSDSKEHIYVMPITVNDAPALEAMGKESLWQILYNYMKDEVGLRSFDYTVVIPQGIMDLAEAKDYLQDYMNMATEDKEVKNKNAVAWNGWKEN